MLVTVSTIFTSNGRTYTIGEIIRVSDGSQLIQQGYCRSLTRQEARAVLDEYARYAEDLFTKTNKIQKLATKKSPVQEGLLF